MAGLPGNAAGYKFDDVDHVLKVAIGLALGQWLDGRNETVSARKFNLGISRGDFLKSFPNFKIKRLFILSGNKDFIRGKHAHKKCTQIFVPISGSVKVEVLRLFQAGSQPKSLRPLM